MDPGALRHWIEARAKAEGFDAVRVTGPEILAEARADAQESLAAGRLADMAWMTSNWLDRATDPLAFLAGTKSVIVLAISTRGDADSDELPGPSRGRIARYARGRDYHRLFESRLRKLVRAIREELGGTARATVDYGPLLERPLASRSGMGWLGKSTMLLVPGFGPWVLLGAIATGLEIERDAPLKKSCGSCTRCIVACPTAAIAPDGSVLDARLCISYHTIENRGPIPRELRPLFGDWIFGCDACLDSCPVGAQGAPGHPELMPASLDDARPPLAPLLLLDKAEFRDRYRGRAIQRAKRDGFLRNVCIALGNVGTANDLPALVAALDDASPLVRGHAAWGLARLAIRAGNVIAARPALESRLPSEQDSFVREELAEALAALEAPP